MPQAVSGTLLTTDVPTRVFILSLEDCNEFLLQDLDEKTLLVKPEYVSEIYQRLAERASENTAEGK